MVLFAQASLLSKLSRFSESFQDVRLVCPGGEEGVQALLLAAASPFLAATLAAASGDDDTLVLLPDFTLEEIRQFVRSLLSQPPQDQRCHSLIRLLLSPLAATREENDVVFKSWSHEDQKPDMILNNMEDQDSDNDDDGEPDDGDEEVDDPVGVEDNSSQSEVARLLSQSEAEELVTSYTTLLYEGSISSSREFGCAKCGKFRTTCKSTLKTHILSELKLFLFQCSVCDKMFRQKGYLNRHMRTHSEVRELKRRGKSRKDPFTTEVARSDDAENGLEPESCGRAENNSQPKQSEIYSRESEITADDITKERPNFFFFKLIN